MFELLHFLLVYVVFACSLLRRFLLLASYCLLLALAGGAIIVT
jgi:hypothetical protein